MGFRKRRGQFKGIGYPSCSREVVKRARNTRDPLGLYGLLGVTPWASDTEIKRAYRDLSRAYHPDGSSPDREKFEEVSRAYRVLSESRDEYNELPDGLEVLAPGESSSQTFERVDPVDLTVIASDYSYWYDDGQDTGLSREWYRSLLDALPRWGYRERVCVSLSRSATYPSVVGTVFEVPYEHPRDTSIFLLCLSATRLD